jgi:hypothetical protein
MEKKKLTKSKVLTVVIFLIGLLTVNNSAQGMDVPVNLQAALFQKIFMFNKTLQAKGIEVAVLSADDSGNEVASAFNAAGINAKVVKGGSVPAGVTVVYVMPGVSTPKEHCAKNGIFSISGVGANAENGGVAIGIGVEGGKPKIIVNAAQLKAESQEVSADLLKIAKVIQ